MSLPNSSHSKVSAPRTSASFANRNKVEQKYSDSSISLLSKQRSSGWTSTSPVIGFFELPDGFRARMDYAREQQFAATMNQQADLRKRGGDWNCAKCTINNFNKRSSCFKCGTSREASEEMDRKGCGMIGTSACDTLIVRELPLGCSEDSLMQELSQYTTIPIQRVCLAESRRYAFVQTRTIEEAGFLLSTFTISAPIIGNCAVIVNYSRQSLNRILLAESVSNLKHQSRVSATAIAQACPECPSNRSDGQNEYG
uniref:RanBP2-type domain-containing protein n=1 Tax=Steinernema glaseri TaxID=37863 RepID=A0A1I8AIK2_9BILA